MWDRNLPAGYGYYHKTIAGSIVAGDDKMTLLAVTSGPATLPALSGTHASYGVIVANASAGEVDVTEAAADGGATVMALTSSDQAALVLYFSSTIWHAVLL